MVPFWSQSTTMSNGWVESTSVFAGDEVPLGSTRVTLRSPSYEFVAIWLGTKLFSSLLMVSILSFLPEGWPVWLPRHRGSVRDKRLLQAAPARYSPDR